MKHADDADLTDLRRFRMEGKEEIVINKVRVNDISVVRNFRTTCVEYIKHFSGKDELDKLSGYADVSSTSYATNYSKELQKLDFLVIANRLKQSRMPLFGRIASGYHPRNDVCRGFLEFPSNYLKNLSRR